MTPICSEHAALLRGIAKNTNDRTAQLVYADWLQERGNPGWVIVRNYHIRDWLINTHDRLNWKARTETQYGWRLPWLDGLVPVKFNANGLSHVKQALTAYADGRIDEYTLSATETE